MGLSSTVVACPWTHSPGVLPTASATQTQSCVNKSDGNHCTILWRSRPNVISMYLKVDAAIPSTVQSPAPAIDGRHALAFAFEIDPDNGKRKVTIYGQGKFDSFPSHHLYITVPSSTGATQTAQKVLFSPWKHGRAPIDIIDPGGLTGFNAQNWRSASPVSFDLD